MYTYRAISLELNHMSVCSNLIKNLYFVSNNIVWKMKSFLYIQKFEPWNI